MRSAGCSALGSPRSAGGEPQHAGAPEPLRLLRAPRTRVARVRAPRRGRLAAGDRGHGAHRRPRGRFPQAAAVLRRLSVAQPRGRRDRRRDAGRHFVRVWLSRRRAPAVRGEAAGLLLHPGLPCAPAGAGDQRALGALLLLARAALARARLLVGFGARDAAGRRGGFVGRGQRFRGHGGSAARRAALHRRDEPLGAVRDHDLRHGDDRGHGHGALRHVPRADGARCPRAHPDRFDHCHARGDRGGAADGPAGARRGRRRHRREARAVGGDREHGRDHPRDARRRAAPDQHRRHAARVRGARESRQRRALAPARCRGLGRHAATAARTA